MIVALFLVVGVSLSHAWGPISHAVFNCMADLQDVKTCLESAANATLVVGSDIPDVRLFDEQRFDLSHHSFRAPTLTIDHRRWHLVDSTSRRKTIRRGCAGSFVFLLSFARRV